MPHRRNPRQTAASAASAAARTHAVSACIAAPHLGSLLCLSMQYVYSRRSEDNLDVARAMRVAMGWVWGMRVAVGWVWGGRRAGAVAVWRRRQQVSGAGGQLQAAGNYTAAAHKASWSTAGHAKHLARVMEHAQVGTGRTSAWRHPRSSPVQAVVWPANQST